jgi:hypothetical protein
MKSVDLVLDSLARVHELVPAVLDGLDRADVLWRPDPGSNSIGWLVWHLTRVEDDHIADIGGRAQVWQTTWRTRLGLPYEASAHGYGMAPAEVAQFAVNRVEDLIGYAADVAAQSRQIVGALGETDFDTVIDTRWDPPVTVGVRLVSVMVETAQHIGQAAYLRGLRERAMGRTSAWAGHV